MTAVITIVNVTPERVRLQVVESGAGDTRTNRIVRTDVNGTRNVRSPAGVYPLNAGTNFIGDYEAAIVSGTSVKWTAYTVASLASGTLTSPVWDYSGWSYLTCPAVPALGQLLAQGATDDAGVVVRYDDTRAAGTTLHYVVGREDPIPILRPSTTPTGSFEVTYSTLAAALNLRDMLARGYVWMLRQSDQDTLDFYFVATATTLTHSDDTVREAPLRAERRWTLSVQFTQVAPPGTDVTLLVGWTYAVVAATYTSYGALLGSFATYADLTVRHPS